MPIPPQDYTLTTTLRLLPPYDVKAMNDEFQDATLLSVKDGVATFRITYHLFHKQVVTADPNWRKDDAKMAEYLRPRPAANWDPELRKRIIADLKADGIDPDNLDDKTLVEKVSRWAMRRAKSNDQFGLWMVEFDSGKPEVPDRLRGAFERNEPKGLTDAQLFDRELFGKGMYLNKTHGACTSSSTYLATILRALGIPTRIVVTVPAADGNDRAQVRMIAKAIRHKQTRLAVVEGVSGQGFSNHLFNEVYVGKKWVRLNYDVLGQGIVDHYYDGLMTHIYTAKDVSEIPFATTWGPRYGMREGPKLSSSNPYQLLSAEDHVPDPAHFDNPPAAELTSATIAGILVPGDPRLPSWLTWSEGLDALVEIKEWIPTDNFLQLRAFAASAASKFVLRAEGHPDVGLELVGGGMDDEKGTFQAFAARFVGKPEPGVAYRVVVDNAGQAHTWVVPPDLTFRLPG
ncbi:MAG TPA: transglutaminase domain-containing protein [Fimbriimonadaceae bacterium]|nr:transglutaminase domain-containing protein [Fimbriimonadaceae bacterium]